MAFLAKCCPWLTFNVSESVRHLGGNGHSSQAVSLLELWSAFIVISENSVPKLTRNNRSGWCSCHISTWNWGPRRLTVISPNPEAFVFLLSSQLLGYGFGVYWGVDSILWFHFTFCINFESRAAKMDQTRLRNFGCSISHWELFPEWVFPLTGFSIFWLANSTSTDFTYIFGGSNGNNEGLGSFWVCFDWRYISGGVVSLNML